MNFATKDRFRLDLLLYRKVGQISLFYYHRHIYSPNKVAMYANEQINKQKRKYKQKRNNNLQ